MPDYHSIISKISKNKAINLMQNADLTEKCRILENTKSYYHV